MNPIRSFVFPVWTPQALPIVYHEYISTVNRPTHISFPWTIDIKHTSQLPDKETKQIFQGSCRNNLRADLRGVHRSRHKDVHTEHNRVVFALGLFVLSVFVQPTVLQTFLMVH